MTKTYKGYTVKTLTKDLMYEHSMQVLQLINEIPLVDYEQNDILQDKKDDRELLGKWEYSSLVFDEDAPIAVLIAYERKAENNSEYPNNSVYFNELAVAPGFRRQGIATYLIAELIDVVSKQGFNYLEGASECTVQTNSAEFNTFVVNMYKKAGFEVRTQKKYPNRFDNVMFLKPS